MRHLGNLDHFLKHLRSSHFTVPEWTFEGLRPKKPPKGEVRLQQVKPKPEDIRPLFDIPFFRGRINVEEPEVPGLNGLTKEFVFWPWSQTELPFFKALTATVRGAVAKS
ncbi:hypothetical protein [Mesorhizobium sp. YM1C-6-2]|uniref:hypothetical protein n=1 Tax=Mesorhizobium sp. YM1C-6-2 TaxID=1827501 RepID=UPI000F133218|nr:hypothetical protein [Mesorhizobium sp. YM1C-6-2]RLP22112.1 hypothetical protein D8676_26060 [Mesorhizobium sp. YM1C-6-2]